MKACNTWKEYCWPMFWQEDVFRVSRPLTTKVFAEFAFTFLTTKHGILNLKEFTTVYGKYMELKYK